MEQDGIKKLREDLRRIEAKVRESLPDIAILLTLSAKAIAERRIKDKGFGAAYSNEKVPAWFLHGKEWSGRGEKFIQSKIDKDEETNWKELRGAEGMQTNYVDLTFSGTMWSNMAPTAIIENGDFVSAPLAATNREVQNKMNWNRDRYGDFIGKALTADDYKALAEVVISELIQILAEAGFKKQG